jgi:hypothetical protein
VGRLDCSPGLAERIQSDEFGGEWAAIEHTLEPGALGESSRWVAALGKLPT